MKDLIIIGGSAAATAAGIYAVRRNLDFQMISKDIGGEVALSGEVKNYPGFSEGISAHAGKVTGLELSKAFNKHLEYYKVRVEEGVQVIDISTDVIARSEATKQSRDLSAGHPSGSREIATLVPQSGTALAMTKNAQSVFKIKAKKGEEELSYKSKSVIVATGAHPRQLGIPGEKEFVNMGVTYCTTCDGPLFKDKIVAVIGGGNSAMEAAIMLSEGIAKKVYIVNINPELQGEKVLIDKLKQAENVEIIGNASTTQIIGERTVKFLEYEEKESGEKKKIGVEGIFIHIGMVPSSDFVKDVEKNKFGEIIVNNKCETNIPGLFAAGDVTDVPYKQIVIAAGQGATASLSATRYLNQLSK